MIFYRPAHPETGEMWDTWLFWHEGTYYLYYLAKHGEKWDNISMATSPDALHWTERGPILRMGDGVTWMGTGSTWKSPEAAGRKRFQMNFSEWKGPRQTIFFAESDDLLHWERLGNEMEFVQDERWYDKLGRWDCIWTLPRPEGGFLGYWTATPKPETGGRFGYGQSHDGVHWEALPPPKVHGFGEGEVGAVEQINGRYIMMFGSYPQMTTLVADKPEGPFHVVARNRNLLGGHTYFTRFFPGPDSMLVCHHSIASDGRIYMGLLKRTLVDDEGTLRFGWWDRYDAFVGNPRKLAIPIADPPEAPVVMLEEVLDTRDGLILQGQLVLPSTPFAPRRGFAIECGDDLLVTVLFDAHGRGEFSKSRRDGSGHEVVRWVDREVNFGRTVRLRVVLEHALMECYLVDILIDCFSLPTKATGRVGLITGGDANALFDLFVSRCEPSTGGR
jgi:hypothetical protein